MKNYLQKFSLTVMLMFALSMANSQCVEVQYPSTIEFGTGRVDIYGKYDGEIKAGKLLTNTFKGWVNFDLGNVYNYSYTSTIIIDKVEIQTYTSDATTSADFKLKYVQMTKNPFSASRTEIMSDIGSNINYTQSSTVAQTLSWSPSVDLGPDAVSHLQSKIDNGVYYFAVGFEENGNDDPKCHIAGNNDTPHRPMLIVTYHLIPNNPANPTSNSPNCNSVTITRNGTPNVYETWYWQTSSTGTSTSLESGSPLIVSTSGIYYIRARSSCGDWSNGCGSVSVTVNNAPNQPGTISGNSTACLEESNSYSISPLSGADSYTWNYFGEGTISGSGASINLSATSNGTLIVMANNVCGSSTWSEILITVNSAPTQPETISGNSTVCAGESNSYSISPVSGADSYTWEYSGEGDPSGSGTSVSLLPTSSGTLRVMANNVCGSSTWREMLITVNTIQLVPTSLTATNITTTGAVLGWTSDGNTWNIEWGEAGFTQGEGTLIEGATENPYSLTVPELGTAYAFYVQADGGACGTSDWAGPFTFVIPNCEATNQCDYIIDMVDSDGDGWNNGYIIFVEGTIPVGQATIATGAAVTQPVAICDGQEVNLIFIAGNYPVEIGFTLRDPFGGELVTFNAGDLSADDNETVIYTFTSSCTPPACPMPTDLTVSDITIIGADLGWTSDGVTWNIEWGMQGFAQGEGTLIEGNTNNPYSLTELESGTAYAFYVQNDCGVDGTSYWTGPFIFETTCETYTTLMQGFETSVPPTCWANFQNAAGTKTWTQTDAYVQEGTYSAKAGYEDSGAENQQWLVTGQITMPANHKLVFYATDDMLANYSSTLKVMVSTDADQMNTGPFTEVLSIVETDVTYRQFSMFEIDMTTYAGQDVYIAFVMIDDDGDNWFLDNVVLTVMTGVENNMVEAINLYPNPSTGLVNISNVIGAEISVSNVLGQEVYRTISTQDILTIDASGWRQGSYIVRIIENGEVSVMKFNIVK